MLVKNKVEAAVTKKKEKKKREHIVFEDGVQAATNPEAKELIKKSVQYSNKIEDKPNLVLIEGQLPQFKIKVGKEQKSNSGFTSSSFIKKIDEKSEMKMKRIQDRISDLSKTQLSILQAFTGVKSLSISDENPSQLKKTLLGKRNPTESLKIDQSKIKQDFIQNGN